MAAQTHMAAFSCIRHQVLNTVAARNSPTMQVVETNSQHASRAVLSCCDIKEKRVPR